MKHGRMIAYRYKTVNDTDTCVQGNISLGQVTRSVCRGVVSNLAGMMTPDMLRARGVTKIVGSGACLIRNPVLQREIQDMYQTPVYFVEEGNACIGAAMAVADRCGDMH